MTSALNMVLLVFVFAFGAVTSIFLDRVIRHYSKKSKVRRKTRISFEVGILAVTSWLAFLPPGGLLLKVDVSQLSSATARDSGLLAVWLPFDIPATAGAALAVVMVFALLCLLVAVTDIDANTMEIPNIFPLLIAVLGLLSICFGPTAFLPWYDHLIGAFVISIPLLLLAFLFAGSFGLGDVKLMAAAGLFLGWQLVLVAAFIGILVGGAYGLYLLAVRKKGRKDHFAFAPSLCIGIALSVFFGQQIISWYLGFF